MGPGERIRIGAGREAEILLWDNGSVLRLMRDPNGMESLQRQAAAVTAAKQAGCPVPWAGEIMWFDGRPGMVMERVDGPDLLSSVTRRPWTVVRSARLLARIHNELHQVSAPRSLPETREALRRRIQLAVSIPKHLAAFALNVLGTLPDGGSLCHGHFHPGNLLLGSAGPFVIDWTGATRGDPDGDVARTLFLFALGSPCPGPGPPCALSSRWEEVHSQLSIGSHTRVGDGSTRPRSNDGRYHTSRRASLKGSRKRPKA